MSIWQPKNNTYASTGSVDRNKGPIADALSRFIHSEQHSPTKILEIASGFGDHIKVFASQHETIEFQPTEAQQECLDALAEIDSHNIAGPLRLNVLDRRDWQLLGSNGVVYDAVININMIHISPAEATRALFQGAASVLRPGGFILLYGAYLNRDGTFGSSNDMKFDRDLKSRDESFGLRNPTVVDSIARQFGFRMEFQQEMALGNKLFIWRLEREGD